MARTHKPKIACRADRRNDARENKRKFEPIIKPYSIGKKQSLDREGTMRAPQP